ncbi:mechanosensitive ion channel family protein [Leptolyngbya cf. ectocarpi LEGE 11479]|uniref:Mechanosensitive ion channel family protein n=1 Tax=Leptolyngbya cf. ectocarpi LEGE 11479 TaxID=1828722 RepID=A0A928ZVS2_LEPEC|nr:mechanosensitive ion channel family protein [Leptolyngbya ectocarpi]MBE9068354.1 mechanosensitive ion channel family protein [Leptolyngbya cf. ectocarpi LEGE 11479]
MKFNHWLMALLTGVICFLLASVPVDAQFDSLTLPSILENEIEIVAPPLPIETAAVRLDGRFLFQVAVVDGISPTSRAKEISKRLQAYVADEAASGVTWKVDNDTNQPVIFVGDQFLMTVTTADAALVGVGSTEIRAEELRTTLTDAIAYYQYERQPKIIQQRLRRAGALLLAMLAVGGGLYKLHHWLSNDPEAINAASQLVSQRIMRRQAKRIYELKNWFLWLGELLIWGGGSFIILGLFPYTRLWQQPLIQLLRVPLRIAIAIFFGYAIIHLGDLVIDRLFLALYDQAPFDAVRTQRTSLRFSTFSQVTKSILVLFVSVICGLIILAIIGIDLGPILASAGIIGLALSLASQSLLKDVINGFMILMEDHYGIGDIIIVREMTGLVETMNLRITQLRNEEGRLITIPNGQIDIVQNLSKEWSRVDLKIPIALNNDIDEALELIKNVADTMREDSAWQALILETPLLLGVDNIDHVGATVRLWIKTLPLKQWEVAREYRRRLKIAFEQANIDFGVPQQRVKVIASEPLNGTLLPDQ